MLVEKTVIVKLGESRPRPVWLAWSGSVNRIKEDLKNKKDIRPKDWPFDWINRKLNGEKWPFDWNIKYKMARIKHWNIEYLI